MAPNLTALGLNQTDFAAGGGNLLGFSHLCGALADSLYAGGLLKLDLGGNKLGPDAGELLAKGLTTNSTLRELRHRRQFFAYLLTSSLLLPCALCSMFVLPALAPARALTLVRTRMGVGSHST